jgi:hypothetical protein
VALASSEDISARLGRALSEQEETSTVVYLLEAASAVMEEAAERTAAELEALDPFPPLLRFVTVELVCRSIFNPGALYSYQEKLGAYSYVTRYRSLREDGTSDLVLTKTEELLVRRAVNGTLAASATAESLINDICVVCGLAPSQFDGLWVCGCDSDGS